MFCPNRAQFSSVKVVLKAADQVITQKGVVYTGGKFMDISYGADNKGTMAGCKEDEDKLLELAKDPRTNICLWADREAPKEIKTAEKDVKEATERAERAEAELEILKTKMASKGYLDVETSKATK